MFVSHILLHRFFVVGFIIGGLSEIFMRDELRESYLRSFVPWIMTYMYLIWKKKKETKQKKNKKKKKNEKKIKQKKRKKKQTKKKCKNMFVSHILLHRFFFFVDWVHHWGFG